jgi:hypothetical protein
MHTGRHKHACCALSTIYENANTDPVITGMRSKHVTGGYKHGTHRRMCITAVIAACICRHICICSYICNYICNYIYIYISMYMYSILLGRWKNGRPRARNQGNTMQHVTVGYQDGTRCRMCITAVIVLTSPMELVT